MKVYELMNALSTCSACAEIVVSRIMTEGEFLALKDYGGGRKEVGGAVSAIDIDGKVYIYLD